MEKSAYFEYIYKVEGEVIKIRPDKIFEASGVYLIVDKGLKLIWIWAGSHSRLFHRYMAANWCGKLKTKKRFFNFKYEVIKQGMEPSEFSSIYREIMENRTDLEFPGQTRRNLMSITAQGNQTSKLSDPPISTLDSTNGNVIITAADKSRIKKILNDIKEMQMHIKYSIDHIHKRFAEIEKLLSK